MKEDFILNEMWTLTFAAAFQRASVYKALVDDDKKGPFKIEIRRFIETVLDPKYQGAAVGDTKHINNIYALSDHTKKFASILNGGQLNFGVTQKLLNLHLKYLWCLGKTQTPPHFPVDRRIQKTLKLNPIVSWTDIVDDKEYMKIINSVKQKLNGDFKTVAEYELNHFQRRVRTTTK